MAKNPESPMGGPVAEFIWADNPDFRGYIDLESFIVFDMKDYSKEGKGKKIGHKEGKYKELGKKVQTMHIKEEDKEEYIMKGGK